jgi:hypothetical protein
MMHYIPSKRKRSNPKADNASGVFALALIIYVIIAGWMAFGSISIVFDILIISGVALVAKEQKDD